MKYIIGVDGGSQSTKITIYDERGNAVCKTAANLKPMHLGEGGVAEYPGDDLWDSLCSASRRLMSLFRGDTADILGMGLCTIRFCRCLLRRDGSLSQPAMSWMDTRVSRPHINDNPETAYVTTSSGYITRRLTGNNKDTAANYLGIWPFDRDRWDWDTNKIADFGVTRDMLFDLVPPGALLGRLSRGAAADTGLPEGLPVFATANDKAVEALGVGCTEPGSTLISLGTYIAAMTCGEKNIGDSDALWTNLACIPGRYLYESSGVRRGMWMVSWWAGLIGEDFAAHAQREGLSPEELLNREAEDVSAGSDGLVVIPDWLAPVGKPYRKGMMLGFDGRHGRGHVYRAILEGIAMTMKNNIDAACLPISRCVISGGGSKSDVFMQIFADVLNMHVARPGKDCDAGLGAAISAAVGLGLYGGFEQAAAAMTEVGRNFEPIEENARQYARLNSVYEKLTGFGDSVFERTYEIFG